MFCLAAAPDAHGKTPARPVAVSLLQSQGQPVRLQLHGAASFEPDLGWSGNSQPMPYRLVLSWNEDDLTMSGALPDLSSGSAGPVQRMEVRRENGKVRLELQLSQSVQPSLRRNGDSWILRLELDTPIAAAPVAPSQVARAPAPSSPAAPPAPVRVPTATKTTPPAARPQDEVLLVELTVNGQKLPGIAQAERQRDGRVLLAASAWTEARLATPGGVQTLSDGTPAHALEQVAGLTYRIDRATLGLELNAPASAFVGSTLGPQGPVSTPITQQASGVMLNYDVSVSRDASNTQMTTGALLEAIAFSPMGSLVASGVMADDGRQRSFHRLDTYWRYDMPDRMETIVIGDTVSSGGAWSRPVRFAGLRWGRDFTMQPGFLTMPQLALAGQAALPSTVEVLVNNARRISQPVAPGPFDLPNVPVNTGAGEVNLVVRDILGRETVVKQSYYASPRLLAPDLQDFSVEAGLLRTGYGQDSEYGAAFASGTLRRGLSPSLTGEARIEVQPGRHAIGAELSGLVGSIGVARAAIAVSSDDLQGHGEKGAMVQLGFERATPRSGMAVQYEYAMRGFAPFGEGTSAEAARHRARSRWLANAGGVLWGPITGGMSLVRQQQWDGERITSLGLFLGAPLGGRASLGFSVNKRLDGDGAWGAGVNISVPLENGVFTAVRVDRNTDGRMVGNVSAAANAPSGPGIGWRAEASTEPSQRARAGIQFNTSHAELAADVASDAQGKVAVRAGARGTIGLLGGVPFAARPVGNGSLALVEVEGMPGVPVKRSNQIVATTDARGIAVVTGLLPWQKNQLEIDPESLPMDAELGEMTRQVVPHARSGVAVKFSVNRTRQALVVLVQADGKAVPEGARVELEGGARFIVGRRGEVWLTDLAQERQGLRVQWDAGACNLDIAIPVMEDGLPGQIGPVTCAGRTR